MTRKAERSFLVSNPKGDPDLVTYVPVRVENAQLGALELSESASELKAHNRATIAKTLGILEGVQLFEDFPPIILITAFGDEETHAVANRLGAAAMFDKPFDVDDLLRKVEELVPTA